MGEALGADSNFFSMVAAADGANCKIHGNSQQKRILFGSVVREAQIGALARLLVCENLLVACATGSTQ